MKTQHVPVLLQQALLALNIKPGKTYVDCTLGGGGHALEIIQKLEFKGRLLAFDQDETAIKNFQEMLTQQGLKTEIISADICKFVHKDLQVYLIHDNFRHLELVLHQLELPKVDGILADLGTSTDQLNDFRRGFSYAGSGELDMRMNQQLSVTAKDLLNGLYKKELVQLLQNLADIKFANRLANEIIAVRKEKSFSTTDDLIEVIQKIVPQRARKGTNRNPEAKVFQALRIAVNDELNALREFLPQAFETLGFGGRLVIISFHSGEDRLVKNYFRDQVTAAKAEYVEKLLLADAGEIQRNPRSSSAKLRALANLTK